jgi:rhamnosyltransferase
MKASVICPTFNGGPLFHRCLESILAQKTDFHYEIVVVDSSSTDGTAKHLARMAELHTNLKFLSISQEEFGHGKTRNYAIEHALGEYIAMLTQDAVPVSAGWLQAFVEEMERHPKAAGAFGPHWAYPDCDPLVRRDLELHFGQFGENVKLFSIEDRATYDLSEGLRQFLHFFSDNNACLRRSVWECFPYPEVEFGEDQLWAKRVLDEGYAKLYVPAATVFHSHNYGVRQLFERNLVEAKYFRRHFGYVFTGGFARLLKDSFAMTREDCLFLRRRRLRRSSLSVFMQNFSKLFGHYVGGCLS